EQMIGRTPHVRLRTALKRVPVGIWQKELDPGAKERDLKSELFAKIEYTNPAGSAKDRIALKIINDAEKSGRLKPGGTIVEATSGNTGAGLAMIAAIRGYKTVFCMPDKISAEKVNSLRAYGSKVVISPTSAHPDSPEYYCNVAKRIAAETPGGCLADQYFTPSNPTAHYETTGPEIWEQMKGKIDFVAAGIGTGGTLSGTAKYLREKNPKIKVVALDPVGSIYRSVIETGKACEAGTYLVEGVGEDILPGTMDLKIVDTVVTVNDEESFRAARMLAQAEGLLVGGSCGLALFGVLQYLAQHESKGGAPLRGVVILPDSGSRYLTKVFNDPWLKENSVNATSWADIKLGGVVEFIGNAKKIPGI
ncbi:MAG TPA: cysteine synthase family protein, partial [Bdellovibrionota bacterium]|nr:cysteine synthase family protein [Bdellovibrionota bacterium]